MPKRDPAAVWVHVARLPQRSSRPVSARNWRTTDAKASFTSITEMSSHPSPAFLERLRACLGIPVKHAIGIDAGKAERDESRARLQSVPLERCFARKQHCGRAVDDRARVSCGHDTVRLERGLQGSQLLERRIAPRRLVDREQDDRPARTHLDGDDLVLEVPVVDGGDSAAVRLERVLVELPARRFHSSAMTSAEIPCGTIGQRSPIFSFTAPHRRRRGSSPSARVSCAPRPRHHQVEVPRLHGRRAVERGLE